MLVQTEKAGRLRGQDFTIPVPPIACGHVNAVAIGGADGTTEADRNWMDRGNHYKILGHVELPDRLRLTVAPPQGADVEANGFTTIGDEIQSIAFDQRRAVDWQVGPVQVPILRQPW